MFDAQYWVANLRNPVRFSDAIAAAAAEHTTFIEISPHPLLTHAITETLGDAHHHSLSTLQRDANDTLTFHTNLNSTHTTHPPHTVHPLGPHASLPTTPWHHTHHWITAPEVARDRSVATELRCNSFAGSDGGDGVPDDWFYELTWPIRELPAADTASRQLMAGAGGRRRRASSWDRSSAQILGCGSGTRGAGRGRRHRPHCSTRSPALRTCSTRRRSRPTHLDVASGYRLFNAARRLAATLAGMASPPKLVILTRNAQPD